MEEILLKLITLLHIIFILFVIGIPLTNSNYFLMIHSIIIPFLIIHWLCNDNTCILTIIERNLKKKLYGDKYDDNDCFTCRLIEPIYDFKNNYNTFSKIIYIVTIILWLISIGKLYCKYRNGEINTIKKLFIM